MRHYYRIEASAFAPTEMSVPAVTCESMNAALDKLSEIGNEWRDKLNAPLMREIGGHWPISSYEDGVIDWNA